MLELQEEALFLLLFDEKHRIKYKLDPIEWLDSRGVKGAGIQDFLSVNINALDMEANYRSTMILEQVCRKIPLSFLVWSAIYGGDKGFRGIVEPAVVKLGSYARAHRVARHMFEALKADMSVQGRIRQWGLAIINLDARRMASVSNIDSLLDERDRPNDVSFDETARYTLSPHTSWSLLPCSELSLRGSLIPPEQSKLWLTLSQGAINRQLFDGWVSEPGVCVSMADMVIRSRTDNVIEFKTIYLPEIFRFFLSTPVTTLQFIDIKQAIELSGSCLSVIDNIKKGFEALVYQHMLIRSK